MEQVRGCKECYWMVMQCKTKGEKEGGGKEGEMPYTTMPF